MEAQIYTCQKVAILLTFLVGFGFCMCHSSYSSEVSKHESNSGSSKFIFCSKRYLSKSYFEKYGSLVESKFQYFIANELLSYSCKWLPDNQDAHLRLSVPSRLLIGEGSHRHLYSSIRLHAQSKLISKLPNCFCKVIFIERLPIGVFADPFELQHLLHRGVFTDITVFGDTNLELPSVASNRSVVEIHMDISPKILLGQTNELEISINLPLHARYPPLGEGDYARVEIGRPEIFIYCTREENLKNEGCLFCPISEHVESKTEVVVWMVAAGKRGHALMVSIVTFVTAFISTLVILITSMFYSDIKLVL